MRKQSTGIAGMDPLEFEKIYHECYRKVVACLVHEFRFSEDDAIDVATKSFMELFEKSGLRYNPSHEHQPCSYIIHLAKFRAHDHLRSVKRREKLASDVEARAPQVYDPRMDLPRKNLRMIMHRLPQDLKRLCELKIAGFTAEEMACRLGLSVPEVRASEVRLRKALAIMIKSLGFKLRDLM